ncbi:MAG: alpha/beta hydrolase [Odoribacter sp.]|nr:alpha/beta hydrolase [Odoribacter sp.]
MKLFFRKYGNGPPLFILHGLYGSSDNWVTIAKSLSGNFTVYLPDQRNHGHSPHSSRHDYDSLSQDLLELTRELKISKFFLAGHSMGGKVAVDFAMKWPEMINSLIIIDISPFRSSDPEAKFFKEHKQILGSILSVDLSGIGSRAEAEAGLSEKIDSEKIRGYILKNLQRTEKNTFGWKMNVKSLYDNLDKIADGQPRPDKETQSVTGFPVTVIKGEDSDYIPPGEFTAIQKLFPSAELITVKNAGHWVHTERPDAIIEILLNQLK